MTATFCPTCWQPAQPRDAYCVFCGFPLRQEGEKQETPALPEGFEVVAVEGCDECGREPDWLTGERFIVVPENSGTGPAFVWTGQRGNTVQRDAAQIFVEWDWAPTPQEAIQEFLDWLEAKLLRETKEAGRSA